MKLKYIILSIIMWSITYYSSVHPEKYHILIPVVFGAISVLLIAILAVDRKEK